MTTQAGEKNMSSMKSLLMRAWRERWSDIQWGITVKRLLTRFAEAEMCNLADLILQQALVGTSPNTLVLSYLKHVQSTQIITTASVLKSVMKYEDLARPYCIKSLLELVTGMLAKISSHAYSEDSIALCKTLQQTVNWALQLAYRGLQSLQDNKQAAEYLGIVDRSCDLVAMVMKSESSKALMYIAKFEDSESARQLEQTEMNVRGVFNQLQPACITAQLKEKVEGILKGIENIYVIPTTSQPSVSMTTRSVLSTVSVMLNIEAVLNPTNDVRPIMEQLILLERAKKVERTDLYCLILRACFMGMIDSKDGTEELKWAAFTYLKLPLLFAKFSQKSPLRDCSKDLETAFEKFLNYVPLLDLTDSKCNCDCLSLFLKKLCTHGLLSDAQCKKLLARRMKDTQKPKTPVQQNQQPSASLILRAEPTVASILKTLDADYSKSQESLLGILFHMLSGRSFELILAAAAATGKLQSFAMKMIKFNEFAKQASGDTDQAAQTTALLFDITFLMVCHIAQLYGSEIISSNIECADSFFAQWVKRCLPEDGKAKCLDNNSFQPDPLKVESLLQQFNAGGELKTSHTKWQDVCNNIPFTVQEVLYAWEHGAIMRDTVRTMMGNIKSKLCCLPVVVVSWLCTHISSLNSTARMKPLQMIDMLQQPVVHSQTPDTANQYYSERSTLMNNIILKMAADLLPATTNKTSLSGKSDLHATLKQTFLASYRKGWLSIQALHDLEQLYCTGGAEWFCETLVKEMLQFTRVEELEHAVALVSAIFFIDMDQLTLSLLHSTLPQILQGMSFKPGIVDPRGRALIRLCVFCIGATHTMKGFPRVPSSPMKSGGKKRSRREVEIEDIEFGTGEARPSKIRKTQDEAHQQITLDAEGFNLDLIYNREETPSSPTYDVKDPLNKALAALFQLFTDIVTDSCISPKTGFVLSFLEETIHVGGDFSRFILQFMPKTMVPQLLKMLPDDFSTGFILNVCDMNSAAGRRIAAKVVSHHALYLSRQKTV
ncbi:mediator of RNA polymerase II transcription subunit 24-like isoform X2 [Lingula anatina]|uniref:Mediator of RNA polymerase II transcription subunit 24 n=1 Tax=Lingula anatina TaxID=7574 RepID=A0A1S3HSE7_LINAN|nr:mediator of RNA polymerase II transcription subunit 24-like isoform X2 [Lingula anatina]|eukprot:XP_013388960.1 mediator of RNA polymerase II transcription subunit 24-like isoform X2 [Lingula anatina]